MRNMHVVGLALAAGILVACGPADRVTAPGPFWPRTLRDVSGVLVPENGSCLSPCVLFNSVAPLWSAIANPDSDRVPIAALRYAPSPGDSLSLTLTADGAALAGLPDGEFVVFAVGATVDSVPLRTATTPVVVWRFASADTTTIFISLNRALAGGPAGQALLAASSPARIVGMSRPWVAPADSQGFASKSPGGTTSSAAARHADVASVCGGQAVSIFQDGTYCGVDVHFFQAVPADAFLAAGATFQSDPGHGQSHEITVTFSRPVLSVTVTAYDPTFAGNEMIVYDTMGGAIGTVPFPGNNKPGTLTTQTGTVTGAITSLHLIPAQGDYVAYSMRVEFAPSTSFTLTMSSQVGGILAPTWKAYRDATCRIDARSSSRTFRLQLSGRDSASAIAVAGRSITVSAAVVPFSGSHMHDNGERPSGSFQADVQTPTATVVSDTSGAATVTFYPPEVAGLYVLTASSPDAPPVSDTLTVGYRLAHLPSSSSYTFTGEAAIHPDAHYAMPAMALALQILADSMRARGMPLLGVNDESLSLGGLFDLDANWMPPRHCSHRDGVAADIETKTLSATQVKIVERVWQHIPQTAGYLWEGTHLHMKILR